MSTTTDTTTTLIVFGVSGDLATRKLLPALYWLAKAKRLPEQFTIVGVSRRKVTPESLIAAATPHIGEQANTATMKQLLSMIRVVRMDSKVPGEYGELKKTLKELEQGATNPTRLLYLSIPPTVARPIITAFAEVGLARPDGVTTRLLLEKPFGFDLASAKELDGGLAQSFDDEQIYRIDHYMAKETAQNITVFRFQNPIMRDLWWHTCIERIEIEASESIGIEGRADFYEQTGALRDLIQSHLLGLMAIVMMEQPKDGSVAAFHHERQRLIEAIKPIKPDEVARVARRGQYDSYRQEVGNPDSDIETFAALRLEVDNERWRGVPAVLMTGKGLTGKCTEIRVLFRGDRPDTPNWLRFRIQPKEGIELELRAKRPGLTNETAPLWLKYAYPSGEERQPESYERVLVDAMSGEQTNFTTGAEVLAMWKLLEPVLHSWEQSDNGLEHYTFGSAGPDIAELKKI